MQEVFPRPVHWPIVDLSIHQRFVEQGHELLLINDGERRVTPRDLGEGFHSVIRVWWRPASGEFRAESLLAGDIGRPPFMVLGDDCWQDTRFEQPGSRLLLP